jgi:hypothetical protein
MLLGRRAESITLIRAKRDKRKQEHLLCLATLVLCGLKVPMLPKGQVIYELRNGKSTLQVDRPSRFWRQTILFWSFLPVGEDSQIHGTAAGRKRSSVLLQ